MEEACFRCGILGAHPKAICDQEAAAKHYAAKKWVKDAPTPAAPDPVNHPPHYTSHPSGVECITITQHMGFCLGNAVKYIWRAGLKSHPQQAEGPDPRIQDLEKARWYLDCEIKRLKKEANHDENRNK